MKKWVSLLAMGLLLTSTAWGQVNSEGGVEKGTWELGALAGISIPVGEYGDLTKAGLTLGVPFGYYVSSKFTLGLEMAAQWTGPTDSANAILAREKDVPIDAEISLAVYRFDLYGRFRFRDAPVSPYLVGMVGFYLQQSKVTSNISMNFNDGYLGGGLGLGVQWVSTEKVSTYLEGLFHYAGREGSTPLSILDVRGGLAFLL